MKKTAIILFFIILITLSLCHFVTLFSPVFAQQELQDYLYQYEKYREISTKFQSAKDKYLKYRTLTSQKEAEQSTQQFLAQRAETVRTYFIALKYQLRTTSGVVAIKHKAELSSVLDKEIIWLTAHKKEIEDLQSSTLEDLFEISDRLEDKDPDYKNLSYKTLTAILLGRERELQTKSIAITNLLSDQIGQAQQASETAVLRQWLEEVKNKNYLSQKKIEVAEEQLSKLERQKNTLQLVKTFNSIQENLENSKYFLNQALSYQKEIFEKLKNYE